MLRVALAAVAFALAPAAALAQDEAGAAETATSDAPAWRAPMQRLAFMTGAWSVVHESAEETGWQSHDAQPSTVEFMLDGAGLREVGLFPFGENIATVETIFGYDAMRELYRIFVLDSQFGVPDVYEGNFDDSGALVATNLRTDTPWVTESGATIHFRLTWSTRDEAHLFTVDMTADRGESWTPLYRSTYTRAS